jgi:hypothetical protein
MRLCLVLLAVAHGASPSAVDLLLNRIVQHEQEFLKNLRAHSPIIETYVQEMPVSDLSDSLPTKDHYFLGRMSLADGVNYESFLTRTDSQKGSRLPFSKSQATAYLPKGFAQMTVLDVSNFDVTTFNTCAASSAGDVRCLVFDVAPIDKNAAGKFLGSIWVEDKDDRIVSFNGTTRPTRPVVPFRPPFLYRAVVFPCVSWRLNVAPANGFRAFVYVENRQRGASTRVSRFKSQSRLWGFSSTSGSRLEELSQHSDRR